MQLTVLQDKPACQADLIPLYEGDVEADLAQIKSVKHAKEIVGGLSKPDKMPCYAYNLPASRCKTGAKLSKVPGSVCFGCYAADTIEWVKRKCEANGKWALTRYTMHQTQNALERRYQCLKNPLWVPAMVYLIRHYAKPNEARGREAVEYFRWHDSGDVQDVNHFANIVTVARYTSEVSHWLPTREYGMVKDTELPENLCVRLSAHMLDKAPPSGYGLPTSTVSNGDDPSHGGDRCHAPANGGRCGDCRKCWDSSVANIDYHKHG